MVLPLNPGEREFTFGSEELIRYLITGVEIPQCRIEVIEGSLRSGGDGSNIPEFRVRVTPPSQMRDYLRYLSNVTELSRLTGTDLILRFKEAAGLK